MTEAQCKSETVEELSQQRKRLRCLVTKAEKMDRELGKARTVITAALSVERNPLGEVEFQRPTLADWPGGADFEQLYQEMRDTAVRIRELHDRLRKWDVID